MKPIAVYEYTNSLGNILNEHQIQVIIYAIINATFNFYRRPDMDIVIVIIFIALAVIVMLIASQKQAEAEALNLKRRLALADIDTMKGIDFEHYAAELLRNEGYTKVVVSKASGDFGADITASKGNLRYAVQVKRYTSNVPRTAVSDAVGAMGYYRCNAAMVITNRYLSKQASIFASSVNCVIIDRDVLANWILRFRDSHPDAQTYVPVPCSTEEEPPLNPVNTDVINEMAKSPATEPMSVPKAIIVGIKAYAAADHPGDYGTQNYVVKEQIEAYTALSALALALPDDLTLALKATATKDYPQDYCTRLYVLKENEEAYIEIKKLKRGNIPDVHFQSIISTAQSQFPNDYSTQLFAIHQEMEAYEELSRLH